MLECNLYSRSPGFRAQYLSPLGLYPHAHVDVVVYVPFDVTKETELHSASEFVHFTGDFCALSGGR